MAKVTDSEERVVHTTTQFDYAVSWILFLNNAQVAKLKD